MTDAADIITPAQAVRAMVGSGATFMVRLCNDGLGVSFTYRVADGGDLARCRAILADVKGRPPAFLSAFKAAVQEAVAAADRGAA